MDERHFESVQALVDHVFERLDDIEKIVLIDQPIEVSGNPIKGAAARIVYLRGESKLIDQRSLAAIRNDKRSKIIKFETM